MRPTRDIARAIARLRDQIEDQKENNNPPEQLTVSESASEDVTVSESTAATAKSGADRYLTYDQDEYDFHEYK